MIFLFTLKSQHFLQINNVSFFTKSYIVNFSDGCHCSDVTFTYTSKAPMVDSALILSSFYR